MELCVTLELLEQAYLIQILYKYDIVTMAILIYNVLIRRENQ